jgi:hypothetical protein
MCSHLKKHILWTNYYHNIIKYCYENLCCVQYQLLKISNEHHRSFHFSRAVLSTHSFFFCQCQFDIFLPPDCQIYYFNIRKKLNDLLSV